MKLNNNRARIQIGAVAALTILLSACNPGPQYAKPPAQTPSAFKEAPPQDYKEGEGWKIAQPGDDKLRAKWWEVYNDKQLNVLEEQVQVSNQSIAAAEANFRSARALVVSARSALFPTVTAGPSYTNSRFSSTARTTVVSGATTTTSTSTTGTSTTGTGTTGTSTTGTSSTGTSSGTSTSSGTAASGIAGVVNNFAVPIDVSYTVDLWHKVRNTIAANTYSAQASAADVATALLSTQAELAEDYFEVRALDAERKVLDQTLDNYRSSLQLTQILYKTGIDSDQDVSQAQTQLDTATAQLTDLGVSRAQYEHAIAMLIGKPPAGFALEVAPFIPKPPDVPLALPSELLERRPDIAGAERLVASANAQIGVAKAAYYPQLTLSASGGVESASILNWFTWPSRFWSLGPQLAQTLYEGGARRAATEQAQASYDAAVANYRQTVLTVFQAVEDNLAALRILSTEVGQQHTAVVSSAHYLDLAQTRYKTGVDSYLNVITAQSSVLTNRETEVTIQLRQMTASVQLIMALGGGWDTSQLPKPSDMLVKPPKWKANGPAQVTPVSVTTPNPPSLPAQQ